MIQAASQGKAGVYAIVNTVNGKRYVGSSNNVKNRLRDHLSLIRRKKHQNRHLQASILKYGYESFVFLILEFCDDKNKLLEIEDKWISFYRKERRYNKREKASSNLGYKVSDETKKKISLHSHENKPVQKYDLYEDILLGEYRSASEAAKLNNTNAGNIRKNCRRSSSRGGDFRWKFSSDTRLPMPLRVTKHPNVPKVAQICVTTGKILNTFENVRTAAEQLGYHDSGIYRAIRGNRMTTCAGFRWEYVLE